MCMCNPTYKGRPRNDLYYVGRDILTDSLTPFVEDLV